MQECRVEIGSSGGIAGLEMDADTHMMISENREEQIQLEDMAGNRGEVDISTIEMEAEHAAGQEEVTDLEHGALILP